MPLLPDPGQPRPLARALFRQLPRAERLLPLNADALKALQGDPAEQSDPRALDWLLLHTKVPLADPNEESAALARWLKAQELCDRVRAILSFDSPGEISLNRQQ